MLTPEALLELHGRTHFGTAKLLEHCAQLSADELHRDLKEHGFAYCSVQAQLFHILEAEDYWFDVLRGRFVGAEPNREYEERGAQYPTVDSLEAYRAEVEAASRQWIEQATAEYLAEPREFAVWDGQQHVLWPAMVVMRPITHAFHHRGMVVAMCRQLGHPAPGSPALDFPIRERF